MTDHETTPSMRLLLRVWLLLGLQSFGGGAATLALIRQAVVERHRWMSEAEFTREWTLVQATPGINLIAMTILIGRRLGGWRGIAICMVGLLLPSVAVTLLLTAGYAHIQRLGWVRAGLRGVIPATVGIGLLTAWQMARAPLLTAKRLGLPDLLVSASLLAASALAALEWRSYVILILCGAGSANALAHRLLERARLQTKSATPGEAAATRAEAETAAVQAQAEAAAAQARAAGDEGTGP